MQSVGWQLEKREAMAGACVGSMELRCSVASFRRLVWSVGLGVVSRWCCKSAGGSAMLCAGERRGLERGSWESREGDHDMKE